MFLFNRYDKKTRLMPYERLSELYTKDWGWFSLKYTHFIRYLKKDRGFTPESVLDISCGTGTLLRELKHDHKVVGSDISPFMLRIARKKNPDVRFYLSDMASLKLKEQFDLVISAFDSLNYLIEKEHFSRAVRNIHSLLKPDGYFLFDVNMPDLYRDKHHGMIRRESKGVVFKQILKYDRKRRIARTIFDFGKDGYEEHIQKAYSLRDVRELTGPWFKILETYDLFKSMKKAGHRPYKVLCIAQKVSSPG